MSLTIIVCHWMQVEGDVVTRDSLHSSDARIEELGLSCLCGNRKGKCILVASTIHVLNILLLTLVLRGEIIVFKCLADWCR